MHNVKIGTNDAQMIQSAFSGMVNRARRCIGVQGHAFSDE
jgi:hypothetical protein